MGVYLNGNIKASGYLTLPVGSTLNDAIALGGGKNFKTGTIELIRMTNNQKVEKRKFGFNLNAQKGSPQNPYLLEGDILVVNKNLLGKANTILNEIGSPIINAYGIISLFD